MIQELQDLADGKTNRLMMFFPRGAAKSTYVQLFEAWWLAHKPAQQIVSASHTQDLSDIISGYVQRYVRENSAALGYSLASKNIQNWITTNGGRYRAVGVGGGIAGARSMLAAIDDPVKDAEAADSETQRNAVWDWYWGDLMGCLTPGAPIVIIMTRWHEDDLAGRLLYTQPDSWRVVKVPAVAGDNDPMGRRPGEWLWADDDYGYADEIRRKRDDFEASGMARVWAAQYQQEPRPPDGALFKAAKLTPIPADPAGLRCVRAWDLAATADTGRSDPDWTCGVKLGRHGQNGRFVVLDVQRFRGPPEEVENTIRGVAHLDGPSCRIGLPQDPGQAGKSQIATMTRMLAGFTVEASPETGDKATRAAPFAAQVNVGNVDMVEASWNRAFSEELRDFPTGRKDDQVDAASRAFSMLATIPPTSRRLHVPFMGR